MDKLIKAVNEMKKVWCSAGNSDVRLTMHSAWCSAYCSAMFSAWESTERSAWCSAWLSAGNSSDYKDNKNVEVFLKVFKDE